MLRELFKTQVMISHMDEDSILYSTRLVMYYSQLEDGALNEALTDTKGYQFSPSDKIFFMPGCTVPRFKVKQLCEATGMSVVKSAENATVIIKGDNTEDDAIKKAWVTDGFSKDAILWFIKNNYKMDNPDAIALIKELEKADAFDVVSLNSWNLKMQIVEGTRHRRPAEWVKEPLVDNANSLHVWTSEDKKLKDIDDILDLGTPIVYQNDLLAIINSSVVMTEDMYYETMKMFESEDKNNHVLAMELMANCDYQKSGIYLLLLLRGFHQRIYERKEKNHVNFSALCSFFDITPGQYLSLDTVIEKCMEKHIIGKEELPTLMSLAKEEFTNEISSSYFTVSDVEISDELAEAIQKADQIRQAKVASQTSEPVTDNTESND